MNNLGVIKGYPNGTFVPSGNITRAELAAIAARFARLMDNDQGENETQYNDITGHWAESDIRFVTTFGWFQGYPDGTFRPNQPITRAEFVTLVNRMLERQPELEEDLLSNMTTFPDNPSDAWYYLAIQEAANSHEMDRKETYIPTLDFYYEKWTELLDNRNWQALENEWSTAGSAGEQDPIY